MSGIYRPGWQSKTYRLYARPARAGIALEVDRRFREKTGVGRKLNPTSAEDLQLRRIWLRIRDEVVAAKEAKIEEDVNKPGGLADQIDADRRDSSLTEIPSEMRWHRWDEGAELLETWFERPPAVAPSYSAPVTTLIKIDWVLKFQRAKDVFDAMMNDRIWANEAAKKRLAELFKTNPPGVSFGDLSRPVPEIDAVWVNSRPVSSGSTVDGLTAALGGFHLQVAVAGKASGNGSGAITLTIDEIGIYVKDSFDFNGSQSLGIWGYRDEPVGNDDFRKWRKDHNQGGDFQAYSDVRRIRRSPPDVVVVP